jgi:hypothetical protein
LKKAFMIWLLILIYQVSACIGLSFASCCSHEPCNLTNPDSDHLHVHSGIHFQTHFLSHVSALDDHDSSAMNKCSCESPLPDATTQTVCIADSPSVFYRLAPRNQTHCESTLVDLALHPHHLWFVSFNTRHNTYVSRDLSLSVVLLI